MGAPYIHVYIHDNTWKAACQQQSGSYNRPAYEAGPGEFKTRMAVGYYEGEPTLRTRHFFVKSLRKPCMT